jgi:hypothetical protein
MALRMMLGLLAVLTCFPAATGSSSSAGGESAAGECKLLPGIDYHGDGQGLGHAKGTSAADCCTQCASGKYPGCLFFSYGGDVCWFFKDNRGPRKDPKSVSGTIGKVAPPAPPPPPLPPAPPLGPPPAPSPNCTTCKWPKHSWDTIPASVHTSRSDTGPDGAFTDADMENLVKFPLITIEKWQGTDATDSSGKRVFLWEEDAWVNSAKKLKAKNPDVSVVPWMDTTLIYTGWMLDGSTNLNHTLNPSAQAACATGHFRPAEFIERYPQLLVKNAKGDIATESFGQCHVYDHTQARVRQYWRDNCLKMTKAGMDGCGADFSAGGPNSMAKNTVQNTMQFMGLNESVATAWRAGRRQMMIETTASLGNGLLIGKDAAELGDHVNAVLHEGCGGNNGTITLLRSITAKAKALGKRLLYQCHTIHGMDSNTVAAFLIGAGVDHYIAEGGWHQAGSRPISNRPAILDKPLGAPLADAVYDAKTTLWTRTFKSGTTVRFNASGGPGTGIEWGSVSV